MRLSSPARRFLCLVGLVGFPAGALAQATRPAAPVSEQLEHPKSADVRVVGHVLEPEQLEPTDENVASLKLPEGFKIEKWADNLEKPRMIAVAEDGTVYVTRRESGTCILLRDENGDGKADGAPKVVAQKPHLHGIALSPDGRTIYFAAIREVYKAPVKEDGTLGELETIYDDLPDAGQHPNRTMAFGPDGRLYLSVGSTANATDEPNPESATMLVIDPEGAGREIFAEGLRNTIGFGWHPETRAFWGVDHGIDWLGDNQPGEELNLLEQGEHYGWPWIYENGKFNPADDPPPGKTMQQLARETAGPVLLYTAHSSPLQMTFYTGEMFPQEYRGDAFIAMRGSWNRKPPAGYEVVRIHFDDSGRPTEMEPFVTGFLKEGQGESGWGHFARLAGCAQMPDGSLLVGDDTNSVIYRITYEGD